MMKIAAMASPASGDPRLCTVEETAGMGGISCPPDQGFPPTGAIVEGSLDQPDRSNAKVVFSAIRAVRTDGHTLNLARRAEQTPRVARVATFPPG